MLEIDCNKHCRMFQHLLLMEFGAFSAAAKRYSELLDLSFLHNIFLSIVWMCLSPNKFKFQTNEQQGIRCWKRSEKHAAFCAQTIVLVMGILKLFYLFVLSNRLCIIKILIIYNRENHFKFFWKISILKEKIWLTLM